MKLFVCPVCGQRIYFENSICLACGNGVLHAPLLQTFVPAQGRFACGNATENGCNWETEEGVLFCAACRLNKTIPDLSIAGNRERWVNVEEAKRRVVYSLIRYGLDISPKQNPGNGTGIAFDFLSDDIGAGPGGERILTGHDNGVITLNVAEADSPEREKMRLEMGEAYRTLIGHFRHEIGHYYWDRLIRDNPDRLAAFRALFGDDTLDYATALANHYANGAPPDWQDRFISSYASCHAWEDWAETWAHFLHVDDTLEMADAYRVPLERLDGAVDHGPRSGSQSFDDLLSRWLTLSQATNSLNRCMGLPDLYPFVINDAVAEKLRFVSEILNEERKADGGADEEGQSDAPRL